MRAATLTLIMYLLGTTALAAEEPAPVEPRIESSVVAAPAAELEAKLLLAEIRLEEREALDSDAAQFAPRGSFWWMVGVIVVAAVIISVLL